MHISGAVWFIRETLRALLTKKIHRIDARVTIQSNLAKVSLIQGCRNMTIAVLRITNLIEGDEGARFLVSS